jgi:general secretion pathway protein A
MLRSLELRQLDQRVSIKYELQPLSPEESGAYVMHRLSIAGGGAAVSFAPPALARIHKHTGGIPRLINLVCDRALIAAFSARTNRVLPAHVRHAAEALELDSSRKGMKDWVKQRIASFVLGAGVATLLGLGTASLWQPGASAAGPTANAVRSTPPSKSGVAVHTEKPMTIGPVVPAPRVVPPPAPATAPSAPPPQNIAAAPVAATTGTTTSKRYSVLVASFRVPSKADALASQLRDMGYSTSISRAGGPPRGLWHQVVAGPFDDLGSARQGEARLRQIPGYADAHLIQP